MTKASLQLFIATPDHVLFSGEARCVRAEDASGAFGLLPGHADLLGILVPSVLRWRDSDDALRYCALRGGVLMASGGARVDVACRWGLVGDDLAKLQGEVAAMRRAEVDAGRNAQVEQTRLHARAIRQLLARLQPDATAEALVGAFDP